MAAVASKMKLKLLIDRKSNKVLFAEAGKEVVDFICSILTLPVGTVTNLLMDKEEEMVGCLSNLYQSIQNLTDDCIQPDQHKDTVLKPSICNVTEESPLFMLTNVPNKKPDTKFVYKCIHNHWYVASMSGTKCPTCSDSMNYGVTVLEGNTEEEAAVPIVCTGGFVREANTYMLLDDLTISLTSAIAGVYIMNKFNVDVRSIEEIVVDLDLAKGLKLLKQSFQTKNVLTEVFLQGQHNTLERKPNATSM